MNREIQEEIRKLSLITREKEGCEKFAKAQFNLGWIYHTYDKQDEAFKCWSNINKTDNLKAYNQAQFNIGNYFLDSLHNSNKAIQHWKTIDKSNPNLFAKAQHNIAVMYRLKNINDKALTFWQKISKTDNKEIYETAQLNIGTIELDKKRMQKALTHFECISEDYDRGTYLKAQFNIAQVYIGLKKYDMALKKLEKIIDRKSNDFLAQIFAKILKIGDGNSSIIEAFISFLENVTHIQAELFIDFDKDYLKQNPERKFAHYTSLFVVNNLLKSEETSHLRLNTINNVNDPTEGKLLINFLTKQSTDVLDFRDDYQAFISCFTFNHDHLNQFRLYGKMEGQEATGVSLVFGEDLFSTEHSFGNITPYNQGDILFGAESEVSENITKNENNSLTLPKQPLFRCVYIDVESDFISIAQRDEVTFYRECCFNKNDIDTKNANKLWLDYQKTVSDKEFKVKGLIKKLVHSYSSIDDRVKQKYQDFIEEMLLPIRYLFKHSAFHEEQECRMIHITTLHDKLVKTDFDKKFMYIDYGEDVKSNIKQIYIGSESSSYQPFIMKLLGQAKAKHVHISHSPFKIR